MKLAPTMELLLIAVVFAGGAITGFGAGSIRRLNIVGKCLDELPSDDQTSGRKYTLSKGSM